MIIKRRIQVCFYSGNTIKDIIEVDANLVGGEEGVFATCRNPQNYEEVWLIAGDDGMWWFVASYHQDWINSVIAALKRA